MRDVLNKFHRLKNHQQWLVVAAGFLFVLYCLLAAFWWPMKLSQQQLQQENLQLAENVLEAQQLAKKYQQLKRSGGAVSSKNSQSLASIVDSALASHKLTMSRFQPSSSGGAVVRFDSVSFSALLGWLHQLESEYAITVADLTINKTATAGLVTASVKLGKG